MVSQEKNGGYFFYPCKLGENIMRIFKQIGFVFIVIALVMLFRKYPTLGIILAVLWLSRRFFKTKKKSSSASTSQLRQINQNLDNLVVVLSRFEARLDTAQPPNSEDPYKDLLDFSHSSTLQESSHPSQEY